MKLEVVIPVRDKDIKLLSNTVKSVQRANSGRYRVNLVDFGSKEPEKYMNLTLENDLNYTRLEYDMWHKPLLLNYVLKRTTADWFGVLDGDYLVEAEFFNKIIDEAEKNTFLQCRGYEMGSEVSSLDGLDDHFSFVDTVASYEMESRIRGAFGGFQAFPTKVAREMQGYDERFGMYGGEHKEMRERLLNKGLDEKRLQGNPIIIHQTHDGIGRKKARRDGLDDTFWSVTKAEENMIEDFSPSDVITELEQGNRVMANQNRTWGEI